MIVEIDTVNMESGRTDVGNVELVYAFMGSGRIVVRIVKLDLYIVKFVPNHALVLMVMDYIKMCYVRHGS